VPVLVGGPSKVCGAGRMIVYMKVLITGGTGFVCSHAVAAIAGSGHELRLLVRRPEQVAASLDPLGVDVCDVVVGDVLDETVVASAVQGCDAVVHAAAVFSLDSRRAEEMRRTNVPATELVLGQAVARGLDPVVHVSTTTATSCTAPSRRSPGDDSRTLCCRGWSSDRLPGSSRPSSGGYPRGGITQPTGKRSKSYVATRGSTIPPHVRSSASSRHPW